MTLNLMFADADLERQFRRLVMSPIEVGGYLMVTSIPPRAIDPDALRRHIEPAYDCPFYFITSWLVVPNVHPSPHDHHQPNTDPQKVYEIAKATAAGLRKAKSIHFHTHPKSNDTWRSQTDIEFWGDYAETGRNKTTVYAEAAIISPSFEWGIYSLAYDLTTDPVEVSIEQDSMFLSWRDKRLRQWSSAILTPCPELG